MPSPQESVSMALFCDFENVALGVRDAKYEKFDIMPVLERLLLKGSIVVKKAYCDWDRYKGFKASMHEASFELIEIPHVRQSGKNSADIRLVVDALDLCYTKSHVDTFVIISGDSDFSPLVSKLRENAKKVIGVGVKNSTSDLLVANCDEFIFYDDLVREQQRAQAKREASETAARAKRSADDNRPKHDMEARKSQAIALAVETFDALSTERGESGKIWASVLKSAIKRRKPDFSESYFGFRAFGNLLDEAQARGLLDVGRDEKSGAFVYRASSVTTAESRAYSNVEENAAPTPAPKNEKNDKNNGRRKGRGGRKETPMAAEKQDIEPIETPVFHEPPPEPEWDDAPIAVEEAVEIVEEPVEAPAPSKPAPRRGRSTAAKKRTAKASAEKAREFWPTGDEEPRAPQAPVAEPAAAPAPADLFGDPPADTPPAERAKPARKSASRARRPRKTTAAT